MEGRRKRKVRKSWKGLKAELRERERKVRQLVWEWGRVTI